MADDNQLILSFLQEFKKDFDAFKDLMAEKYDKFNTRLSDGSNKFTAQQGLIENNAREIAELKTCNKEAAKNDKQQIIDIDRLKNNITILKWIAGIIGTGIVGLIFDLISRKFGA